MLVAFSLLLWVLLCRQAQLQTACSLLNSGPFSLSEAMIQSRQCGSTFPNDYYLNLDDTSLGTTAER